MANGDSLFHSIVKGYVETTDGNATDLCLVDFSNLLNEGNGVDALIYGEGWAMGHDEDGTDGYAAKVIAHARIIDGSLGSLSTGAVGSADVGNSGYQVAINGGANGLVLQVAGVNGTHWHGRLMVDITEATFFVA